MIAIILGSTKTDCTEMMAWMVALLGLGTAHINHIKRVAGIDHVGLGAGYDGINL